MDFKFRHTGLALILVLMGETPGQAGQTFTSNSLFSRHDLSVWSAGPSFKLDTGQRFLGETWDLGKTYGKVEEFCVLGKCADFGAEIGAKTTGKLGLDYSLKVNSGSFDALYPGSTSITVPSSVQVFNDGTPGPVSLGTQFSGLPSVPIDSSGNVARSTLQVTGPTLQAGLRLGRARAWPFATARHSGLIPWMARRTW